MDINPGILEGILTTLTYGSNTLSIKIGSRYIDSRVGLFITNSASLFFLLIFAGIQYFSHPFSWNWLGVVFFLASGVFTSWLGRLSMFKAVVLIGPAQTGTFQIANPILTLIVAAIALHDIPSARATGGLILSILGLLFISVPPEWLERKSSAEPKPPRPRLTFWAKLKAVSSSGHFIAFFSSVFYAVGAVFRKQAEITWNEPVTGALLSTMIGLVLILPQIPTLRGLVGKGKNPRLGGLVYIVSGFLISIGQAALLASMFYLPSAIATLFVSLQPLIIIPASKFLFHTDELLDWRVISGCLAVVLGMVAIAI